MMPVKSSERSGGMGADIFRGTVRAAFALLAILLAVVLVVWLI